MSFALFAMGMASVFGVTTASGASSAPLYLICEVTGGASSLRAAFKAAVCNAAASDLAERFGRPVRRSSESALRARTGSVVPFVRLVARIVSVRAAKGTVSWGSVRRGQLVVAGSSPTLDVGANDASLGRGSAQLLAQSLIRMVPDNF